MEYGSPWQGNFDIIIVNDDLDTAYGELREFAKPYEVEETKSGEEGDPEEEGEEEEEDKPEEEEGNPEEAEGEGDEEETKEEDKEDE